MTLKPFKGTNPQQQQTIGYMYMGSEAEYEKVTWDNYEVSIVVDPSTITVLATDCTKREAWDFFCGYTKRNPKAHVQIRQEWGQSDYVDTNCDEEIVWSTVPSEVGSISRKRDEEHEAYLATLSPQW